MLDRQNLLKDLRLVLRALTGQESPTPERIEAAMERAEIDASAFADVRHRWAGNISLLVDRIRPVLALFGISDGGLDEATTEIEHLIEWLSSNLRQCPAHEILSAARRSRDDHTMGMAAWRILGDVAQLPAWNAALTKLGDRYSTVENRDVEEQTATHIEAILPLLRGFSRHDLTAPEGPRVNRDEFTPLSEADQSRCILGGGRAKTGKISSNRSSPDLRDLVGVVGEIHAYRFLRAKFGKDVVTRGAWVSEIRLKVLPPVTGESENTSDAHGFDFQFRCHGKRWHVEVKATMGDDPQFELEISEVEAANLLARARGGRWRILRIRHALSNRPEFDWLPNPFEGEFRKHFRFHGGGMMMSYARKKS